VSNFVFLRAKTDWARSNIASKIARTSASLVPYKPKFKAAFQLSEDVFVLALQPQDFLGMGETAYRGTDSFTAFSGFVQLQGVDGRLAEVINRELRDADPADLIVKWAGEFSIGHYVNDRNEFVCFSDYSGLAPLYYIDNADFFAVSNRQMFLNPLCTRSDRLETDVLEMASFISQGSKFGARSVIRGVTMIMPGRFVVSKPTSHEIRFASSQLWESRGAPSAGDYTRAVDGLIDNFNWLGNLKSLNDSAVKLSLTGGEDSRLVMSLALNSNVKDRVEAFTYGYDDNPDIAAARIVAKAANVPHETTIWKRTEAPTDINAIWGDMQYHAFRFEGAPGAWDGGRGVAKRSALDLIGIFDFLYKRVRPSNAAVDVTDRKTFLDLCLTFQQQYDGLGLLNDHVVKRERDFEESWTDEKLSQGAELNDLPDIYYQESRFPWWGGGINTNINGRVRISPLSNRFASVVALKQSVKDRRERRFIFEAMVRLAPHLLEVPYLNKKWPDHFQELAPHIKLPGVEMDISKEVAPAGQPWTVIFVRNGGLPLLYDFIKSNGLMEIFEVVRKDRFEELVANPKLVRDAAGIRAMTNLAEMAILMANKWSVEQDDIDNHNLSDRWETNLLEVEMAWLHNGVIASTGKRHRLDFDVPHSDVKSIRLDPMTKEGRLIFHRLAAVDAQENAVDLLAGNERLRKNGQMRLDIKDGRGVFVSTGNDPNFTFQSCGFKRLELDVTVYAADNFEIFFDRGSGFNRSDMIARHLPG
jgi:hypothetical protein